MAWAGHPWAGAPWAGGAGAVLSGFKTAWTRGINTIIGNNAMKKNVAGQVIGTQMVSATDGSAFTGSVTVYITGNGGTLSIGSVGSGVCTHEGNGTHTYAPSQAETNYDHIAFTFIRSGAVPALVQVYPSWPQTSDVANERGRYADGAVWIGPAANTNTVSYVDGITTNPVSTIAAAKTVADALNLRRFHIIRTGAAQIGADMVGYQFIGSQWSLTTTGGSRDVSLSSFETALVIGGTFASTSGPSYWHQCEFSTGVSVAAVDMSHCTFAGTLTLNAAGNYDFIDCASVVAGSSTPVFAVPAGTVNISFRRWSGGISITGITSGTTISIDVVSGGTVTLAGADGTVNVRGVVNGITDNRTGTPTLNQTAAINRTVLATPTNITAGTITTVGAVTGLTASDVGAIKAKTDPLTFTSAGFVDANVQKINDVTITGDGQPGTEFGV